MDIDIDFANRNIALGKFKHVSASRKTDTGMVAHNTGIYVQHIPKNPLTNLCNIDYKEAEKRGYFKIDFLNVSVYNGIKDNDHLLRLMEIEPIWELLLKEEFVNLLFHLKGYCDILKSYRPTSVEQLAAILAMIRPAKRYLIGKDWTTVMNEVWTSTESGEFSFKKSHGTVYAMLIVVQMNLIIEQLSG